MQVKRSLSSHLPVIAVVLGICLAAALMATGFFAVSILASCCLCIAAFYYNMIHLYSECDGYMGTMPSNRRMYFAGFFVVVIGFTSIAAGNIMAFPASVQIGAVILFIGLVLLLAATKNLFDRIIRSGIA